MEENKTVEQITKSYEEKIAQREKEILEEKKQLEEKHKKEIKELEEKHNKDIADIIMGRKEIKDVQKGDVENDDKSYFDKQVEETKKKLGITKGEK